MLTGLTTTFRTMQPYQRHRLVLGGMAAVFLIAVFLLYNGIIPGSRIDKDGQESVTLVFWDPVDTTSAYSELIRQYQKDNPNVTVAYIKKDPNTYRNDVVSALAAGEGPDVYLIHHTWLASEKERLISMNRALPSVNPALVLSQFPDVVRFDFAREEKNEQIVYAAPLFIDTLALLYNPTYFNSAALFEPPTSWDAFAEYARRLRRIGAGGSLDFAGAALGQSQNVENSADIVSLLMLQGGARMNNSDRTEAAFHQSVEQNGQEVRSAEDAFRFYTSFSDPASENYSWNAQQVSSLEAFAQGRVAMVLGYDSQRDELLKNNPDLDIAVAPVPQPQDRFDKVNYANYWGLAVPKNSKKAAEAWKFINFLTGAEGATVYTKAAGRPAAHKTVISRQLQDESIAVFAGQAPTAKSWFRGDAVNANAILDAATTRAAADRSRIPAIVREAAEAITALLAGLL